MSRGLLMLAVLTSVTGCRPSRLSEWSIKSVSAYQSTTAGDSTLLAHLSFGSAVGPCPIFSGVRATANGVEMQVEQAGGPVIMGLPTGECLSFIELRLVDVQLEDSSDGGVRMVIEDTSQSVTAVFPALLARRQWRLKDAPDGGFAPGSTVTVEGLPLGEAVVVRDGDALVRFTYAGEGFAESGVIENARADGALLRFELSMLARPGEGILLVNAERRGPAAVECTNATSCEGLVFSPAELPLTIRPP